MKPLCTFVALGAAVVVTFVEVAHPFREETRRAYYATPGYTVAVVQAHPRPTDVGSQGLGYAWLSDGHVTHVAPI